MVAPNELLARATGMALYIYWHCVPRRRRRPSRRALVKLGTGDVDGMRLARIGEGRAARTAAEHRPAARSTHPGTAVRAAPRANAVVALFDTGARTAPTTALPPSGLARCASQAREALTC